jgi:hypothetical protein
MDETKPDPKPAAPEPMLNRKQRRQQRAQQTVRVACTACDKVLIPSMRKTLADSPAGKQRLEAVGRLHAPHCKPKTPGFAEAAAIAETTLAECICAGCGTIVYTVNVAVARAAPEPTQQACNKALREHVEATGCSGEHDGSKPTPKRKDARCDHLATPVQHFAGCRCDLSEPTAAEAPVFELLPVAPEPEPA